MNTKKARGRPPARPEDGNVRERILDATLAAITWSGIDHFSITDVSRLARTSRQSLYRYFRNKEDLLDSLIQHLRHVVEERLERQVQQSTSLAECLFAISGYDADATGGRNSALLLKSEPALMLKHLNSQPSRVHAIMRKALDPFLDEAERKSGVPMDRDRLIETIERLRISLFLVPGNSSRDYQAAAIRAIVESAIEHPAAWAKQPEQEGDAPASASD